MPFEDMPTIADLSAPGALQTYINSRMSLYGFCGLPCGTIQYNTSLVLDFNHGGILTGTGMAGISFTASPADPYNAQGNFKATRLYFTGAADQPAIILKNSSHMKFQHFAVERQNRGITFQSLSTGSPAAGPSFCSMDNVSFQNATIGIQYGQSVGDFVNSDWVLDMVLFRDCDVGIKVNHDQGLNYLLNFPAFLNVGIGVHCLHGGCVKINYATSNEGLGTLLRVDSGGVNAFFYEISHARLDRNIAGDPIPIVMDFTNSSNPSFPLSGPGGGYFAKASFITIVGDPGHILAVTGQPSFALFRQPATPLSYQQMAVEANSVVTGFATSNGAIPSPSAGAILIPYPSPPTDPW